VIPLTNVHPLTDFKKNTSEFRARLKRTGRAAVLTVDGRAELVVQDAASYQKLLDALERAETAAAIREGIEDIKHGRTYSASEVVEEVSRRLKKGAAKARNKGPRA